MSWNILERRKIMSDICIFGIKSGSKAPVRNQIKITFLSPKQIPWLQQCLVNSKLKHFHLRNYCDIYSQKAVISLHLGRNSAALPASPAFANSVSLKNVFQLSFTFRKYQGKMTVEKTAVWLGPKNYLIHILTTNMK